MGLLDILAGLFKAPPRQTTPSTAIPVRPVQMPPASTLAGWLDLCVPLTQISESCVLDAYPDPGSGGDPWTIGWGATGPAISHGVVWTQEQADADLASRLTAIGRQIDSRVHSALSAQQKAALGDFIYNVGVGAFESSTLLRLLNAGNYQGAADQFLVWNKGSGKVLPGLVTRCERRRSLFLTGGWK